MNGRVFSLNEILAAFERLSIPFRTVGPEKTALFFASLRNVQCGGIYFIESASHSSQHINHSVIICKSPEGLSDSNTFILTDEPQLAFYKLMRNFFLSAAKSEIDASVILSKEAQIDSDVSIGPYCVIGNCVIKKGARLSSHVVIEDGCEIGENSIIESHTTIGASGVAWIWDSASHQRVIQPQIGGVIVENGVFIGTNVTVVRGSVNENTVIGSGTLMAHGTKIGHGCVIGSNNHFANTVSLAGNVVTGKDCFFGSGSVVRPMINIADDTIVAAGAVVVSNIESGGLLVVGVPAVLKSRSKDKHAGVPRKPKPHLQGV